MRETGGEVLWAALPGPKNLSRPLLDRWRTALREWDAPEPVKRSLAKLDDPRTHVVVTGQQPGVWGGPLYSLYKAATTVSLARRIAEKTGEAAVPVFWIQGEDTDWGEVAWGTLPRGDLSLYRHRWDPPPVESRSWVGSAEIEAPPEARRLLEDWGVPTRLVGGPVGEAPAELSLGFCRLLLAYFGEHGLLPLDGRWPEVRGGGREIWQRYLDRHEELAQAVQERGAELERRGLPAALDGEASAYGLFPLDGNRRLRIDPELWERQIGKRLKRGEWDRVAPSVLLRSVLQDHMFGSTAHVVGDAEASYLIQLRPVYEAMDVHPPARPPRFRGTIAPRSLLPHDRVEEIIADPEVWIAEMAGGEVSGRGLEALKAIRNAVEKELTTLAGSSSGGKELEQAVKSAKRKMMAQVNRLDESLSRRARQKLYQDQPALRNLPEFLRPRRGNQERGLSGASFAFTFGAEAPNILLEATGEHVQRLEEGKLHHFVLESTRV
jgi:uncharacterized protein YllA (UPF0747 family)